MGPVLRVVYCTCDIRRCVMDVSPRWGIRNRRFFAALQTGQSGAGF